LGPERLFNILIAWLAASIMLQKKGNRHPEGLWYSIDKFGMENARKLSIMNLTPIRARLMLAVLVGIVAFGMRTSDSVPPPTRDESRVGDLKLHEYTIERIRNDEPYYSAVGGALREHSYPSTSVLNWRMPLHYEIVAILSIARASQVLAALALLVIVTGTLPYARESLSKTMLAALFLFGAMMPPLAIGPAIAFFPESWAGVILGLSLNAYIGRRFLLGAALGVAALFLRELVAPYALACGLLALGAKRWRELCLWTVGGLAFAVYYAMHAAAAIDAIEPGDLTHARSWIAFLGLPFVFKTLHVYGWLTLSPPILTPIAAALGLAATATPAPAQLRVSLVLYVMLFSVVGQPFNYYWGYVTNAIWAHAFVYSAQGLDRLIRTAVPIAGQVEDAAHAGSKSSSGNSSPPVPATEE
jgi:hypothetical protein